MGLSPFHLQNSKNELVVRGKIIVIGGKSHFTLFFIHARGSHPSFPLTIRS